MSIELTKDPFDIPNGYTVIAKVEGGKDNGKYIMVNGDNFKGNLKKLLKVKLEINDGEIMPVLYKNGISRVFIAGPTKSGKSYLLNKILGETDRPIYFFSRLEHDDSIDNENIRRINCQKFKEKDCDIDMKEFKDGIIVFDDAETFSDKNITKNLSTLRDGFLETGRHYVPAVLSTSHFLCNGMKTRQSLLESNCIIVFPRSGGLKYQFINYLKDRMAFNRNQISEITKLIPTTRWIAIYNEHPTTLISQHTVEIIN
jgi:hypothetical protein